MSRLVTGRPKHKTKIDKEHKRLLESRPLKNDDYVMTDEEKVELEKRIGRSLGNTPKKKQKTFDIIYKGKLLKTVKGEGKVYSYIDTKLRNLFLSREDRTQIIKSGKEINGLKVVKK